jgi:hypothetical protein
MQFDLNLIGCASDRDAVTQTGSTTNRYQ